MFCQCWLAPDFASSYITLMFGQLYAHTRAALPSRLRDTLDLGTKRSALFTLGWFRSRKERMSVDATGRPLAWYSYPCTQFLEARIPNDAFVFEFGMGNSTLWWANHVKAVATVESNSEWYEKISPIMPDNVTASLANPESDDYVGAARKVASPIDIIAIDGRRRVECCKNSIDFLSDRGVVVWDNADRGYYEEGYNVLKERGFKRVDFIGMAPMEIWDTTTSIFYRPNNVLDL